VAGTLGPLGLLPDGDGLWILGMLSIPGTLLWCLILGLVLPRRAVAQPSSASQVGAAVAA
jgi:hypothetical protein